MAPVSSIILPTMIILCMRVNNLPVVHAINVIPVWNATSAQNDSWPCLLSYDYVANPDVISFHGAPFQMCSVQVISSPKTAALIQLPKVTHADTFLYAERQGDLDGCQNRYVAITEAGPCNNIFRHPNINLFLQGSITILLSEISKNVSMTTCSNEKSKTEGDKTMGENQTKQCATLEFKDTISCTRDHNQICSFHFPTACSSVIENRSVEFHCNHTHPNQRFLVIYPTDIVALEFTRQNIVEINGNPFSSLDKLKRLILEYNRMSFLHSSVFSVLDALTYLSLQGNQLVTLDIAFFQNLTELAYLNLSENNLRSLPNSVFKNLQNLSLLDLSNNRLEKLPGNIFQNLQNLYELKLYENQIVSLDNDLFKDTINLAILLLHSNKLTVFPNGLFRKMKYLEFLDLSHNLLASLETDLLNETTNLLTLYLGYNNLKSLPKTLFTGLHNLQELFLVQNSLPSFERTLFQGLFNLKVLFLAFMEIEQIDARLFWDLITLEHLDLGYNKLKQLDSSQFQNLKNLKFLYINRNQIEALDLHLFRDTVNLRLIHLAENNLLNIPNLNNLNHLGYINLQNNSLIKINKNSFANLSKHTEIVVSQPELCECYVSAEINCSALNVRSPYLTCDRLLSDRTLVVIMWLIGLNALCGNMFVLMWRKKKKDRNKVQTFLLSNLAISDFLMGIYMLLIASADIYFGDYFPMQAERWRKGTTCRIAGTISIVSSEASVFFITLISINRLINIRFPFSRRKLATKSTTIIVTLFWLTALALGLIPSILAGKNYKFYDNSHVCIGLPLAKLHIYSNTFSKDYTDHEEFHVIYWRIRVQSVSLGEVDGMFFSSALFLGLNCICYLVILLCYVEIMRTVLKSSKRAGLSPEMKKQVKMTAKVAAIVLTDFLCWAPVIFLGVLVQAGALTLPPSVFAWCVTVILPINSAINPYLYTISHIVGTYREKARANTANPLKTSQSQNQMQTQTIQESAL